jgi:hypothetical protein
VTATPVAAVPNRHHRATVGPWVRPHSLTATATPNAESESPTIRNGRSPRRNVVDAAVVEAAVADRVRRNPTAATVTPLATPRTQAVVRGIRRIT